MPMMLAMMLAMTRMGGAGEAREKKRESLGRRRKVTGLAGDRISSRLLVFSSSSSTGQLNNAAYLPWAFSLLYIVHGTFDFPDVQLIDRVILAPHPTIASRSTSSQERLCIYYLEPT